MENESIVTDSDGNPTHIRVTNDDGTESVLYEYIDDLASSLPFGSHQGAPVEIATHNSDGTTTAYEYDDGLLSQLPIFSHKGKEK
jgi:hypothetical protein